VLLDLAAVLQDLELDWEYELRAGSARSPRNCSAGTCAAAHAGPAGLASLSQNLAEYLAEESRTLVGSAKPKRASANSTDQNRSGTPRGALRAPFPIP
jgi:ubiquinone biosynthesis protein UbiJ